MLDQQIPLISAPKSLLLELAHTDGDFHAMEEQPRDDQPDPDDEAEQTDHIDGSEAGNALLPQLLKV